VIPAAFAIEYPGRRARRNVGAGRRQLLRRFTEQHADGYEIENVVTATGQEAARLNLPEDCVVLLA
jgi:hypothetical protein